MRAKYIISIVAELLFVGLLVGPAAQAQVSIERREAIKVRMKQLRERFGHMSESKRRALSGSAQNLMHMAENWERIEELMSEKSLRPESLRAGGESAARTDATTGEATTLSSKFVPVSNPATDFDFSVVTGFTQSETSTAWCRRNVVVGFNDSGSFPESIFFGPGGLSFNGVARSRNTGRSFDDLGFLNPGPNFFDFLLGDPVVGCANENTFYYASLFATGTPSVPLSAISVSRSTDGGATFGNPVVAASKNAFTHFLDKDWMAVDPTNPNRLFVTYTDFDDSGTVCGFFPSGSPIPRAGIELVRSTDGGGTWSAPIVIAQVCGSSFVQGSQVAVGPSGEVYVLWESFTSGFGGPRALRIRKSVNNGVTFAASVKVDDVVPSGAGFELQGGFRTFLTGNLAVDQSSGPTKGFVYVTWEDGRNLQVPDFFSFTPFYGYADVLIRRSTDGGLTWSAAVRVNDNPEPLQNERGTDQFQPGVAVDQKGNVAVCFYDRRKDPFNFLIGRACAASKDAGDTWENRTVTEGSFPPFHATDSLINPVYMGDYDVLASDFTKGRQGFIGAFQWINTHKVFVPNPDVTANRLKADEHDED